MRFLREIPESHINEQVITKLTQQGYKLVWKEDSVEVWAEC